MEYIIMPGPLIPIRHSDGTVEKVTLEEFKARQKKAKAKPSEPAKPETGAMMSPAIPPTPPKKPAPSAKPTTPPVKQEEKSTPVAKQAPVMKTELEKNPAPAPAASIKPEKVQPAKSPKPMTSLPQAAKTDEGKSLLEEELPAGKQSAPLVSSDRKEEAVAIVNKLNLQINDEVKKRLIGLVQLRLKDVRGEMEVKNWLLKPDSEMGIGLSDEQANQVLNAIREVLKQANTDDLPVAPLKKPLGTPRSVDPKATAMPLRKKEGEPLPARSTPVNPFVHPAPPDTGAMKPKPKSLDDLVKQESAMGGQSIESLIEKKPQPAHAIVRDISPGRPSQLGPVEELRYITLTDFRRLSTNPEEAAARLKQKFMNLKEESYILYMNGLAAWRQSPLFLDYTNAAISALNTKNKMTGEAIDKEKIQIPEIQALVAMQKLLV